MNEWLRFIGLFEPGCQFKKKVAGLEEFCEGIGIGPNRCWDIIRIVQNIKKEVRKERGSLPVDIFKKVQASFSNAEKDFACMVFGLALIGCSFKERSKSDMSIDTELEENKHTPREEKQPNQRQMKVYRLLEPNNNTKED